MLPLVSLSYVDVSLVAASPQMDRDSFLLPSPRGLACTTDPYLPPSPMSLPRPKAGVWETPLLAPLQQNLWDGSHPRPHLLLDGWPQETLPMTCHTFHQGH